VPAGDGEGSDASLEQNCLFSIHGCHIGYDAAGVLSDEGADTAQNSTAVDALTVETVEPDPNSLQLSNVNGIPVSIENGNAVGMLQDERLDHVFPDARHDEDVTDVLAQVQGTVADLVSVGHRGLYNALRAIIPLDDTDNPSLPVPGEHYLF